MHTCPRPSIPSSVPLRLSMSILGLPLGRKHRWHFQNPLSTVRGRAQSGLSGEEASWWLVPVAPRPYVKPQHLKCWQLVKNTELCRECKGIKFPLDQSRMRKMRFLFYLHYSFSDLSL